MAPGRRTKMPVRDAICGTEHGGVGGISAGQAKAVTAPRTSLSGICRSALSRIRNYYGWGEVLCKGWMYTGLEDKP